MLALVGFGHNAGAQSAPVATTPAPDATTPETKTEQAIVLKPFNVFESSNSGYGATSTSSATRVAQDYVSLPQSINVVTADFLYDFNIQDFREAMEYTSNVTFGLSDNPTSTHVRGALVDFGAAGASGTVVDGMTIVTNYNAMPETFFDRIEVIKGPSSANFGLGNPGGLINYVSKMPQGTNATEVSVGAGLNNNFQADFDTQGTSLYDSKLTYRVVGFWDNGNYYTANSYHRGAGAQLSLKYDLDPTQVLAAVVAYSNTTFPSQQQQNNLWKSQYLYDADMQSSIGAGTYNYLPGTKFTNGSIYGVSGTLPPPGTATFIPGTGNLVGLNTNANPANWIQGDNEVETRMELIYTKDFADGHIHFRDQLALDFDQANSYDESPSGTVSWPGAGNTPIAAGTEPNINISADGIHVFNPSKVGATGAPYFGIEETRLYTYTNGSFSTDDLGVLANYKFFGNLLDTSSLIGANFYDQRRSDFRYQVPSLWQDGAAEYANLYSDYNPSEYVPTSYTIARDRSLHTWGDGFYVNEQWNMFNDLIEANAGWRIDYFDTETINYLGGSTFPGWVNNKGAPRFGVTVKPLKWLSVYGLYARHSDPTQVTEEYFLASGSEWGPALQAKYPEAQLEYYQPGGYTIEGGAKANFFNGKLYASVAVFHAFTTGQISQIPVAGGAVENPDGTFTTIGVNELTGLNVHGIEAEIFGQITDRFTFTANYGTCTGYYPAFSNGVPDFFDEPTTVTVVGKLDLGDYRKKTGFYITFGEVWYGPYWLIQNANSVTDYYLNHDQYLTDAGIGFRWKTGKYRQTLYLNSTNILNKAIIEGEYTYDNLLAFRRVTLRYEVNF